MSQEADTLLFGKTVRRYVLARQPAPAWPTPALQ
jgi:hypothetical protein